jgi:hypothetical protein
VPVLQHRRYSILLTEGTGLSFAKQLRSHWVRVYTPRRDEVSKLKLDLHGHVASLVTGNIGLGPKKLACR